MIEHDRPLDDGQNFILTTKQIAEHFGLSPEAIRKIKSQNQDRLIEGTHWINFEGRTCWDESVIAVIEAIRNGTVPENATVTDRETLPLATAETDAPQALRPSDTDELTLDSLADDFDNALRPHAQRVARERVARRFERLVAEAEQQEMERIIRLAGEAADDQSFAAVLDQWEAVSRSALDLRLVASRNGHKALTGVSDA